MNNDTIKTIAKSIIIILILMAVVFALRAPAADLTVLNGSLKANYVDSEGLPYFSEMDSYYNLRLTENFVDHGYVGDEKYDNGTQYDFHRLAPDGVSVHYEMGIVYVTSFFHEVANMFGDFSVKEVAFWTGAIVASLAVIPVYIFSRRITNTTGSIVATLLICLAPNYFAHTFPGFFDTDMFYYIFSVFFIFFFIEAIRTDNKALKVIFGILSFVSIGLFSMCWTGYMFYIYVIGGFVVVYLLAKFIFKIETEDKSNYRSRLKWIIADKDVLTVIFLLVIGVMLIALFVGVGKLTEPFIAIFNLVNLQAVGSVSGFPNVLVSIGEMQVASLLASGMGSAFLASTGGTVNGIGGISVLFAALFGLYFIIRRIIPLREAKISNSADKKPKKSDRIAPSQLLDDARKLSISLKNIPKFNTFEEIYNERRTNLIYASLFLVWTVGTIIAVTRGSRFTTTFVLPISFLTGMFISYAMDYINSRNFGDKLIVVLAILGGALIAYPSVQINLIACIAIFLLIVIAVLIAIYGLKKNQENSSFRKKFVIALLLLVLITPTVCSAYVTATNVIPSTDASMNNSLTWIKEHSSEDTVITSWWDFGYVFEYTADRQVTFDGGTQSGERAFWLGKAMTTDDLELSAGIFRMLNSEGTRSVSYMYSINHDNDKNTKALIDILPLTSTAAHDKVVKEYGFDSQQADKIISYTHPSKVRPTMFIASSDMLQKASWWSYFGDWNFKNQSAHHYSYNIPTKQMDIKKGESNTTTLVKDNQVDFNVNVQRGDTNTTAYTNAIFKQNNSEIYINGTLYNPFAAGRVIVFEDGKLISNTTVPDSDNANFTIFLLGYTKTDANGSNASGIMQYTPIVMSNELLDSMFTKLFFLGGAGQNQFTCVHSESGVQVWTVNFNNTVAGGGSSSTVKK